MDCRSNLRLWQKIFAYHVYPVLTNDLISGFRFAIKWYCWALCLGLNFSRKKKASTCAGWLWIIATTLVYCQKVTPTTYTLYSRMTYASTSVVGKNVATEYQSLYNVKKKFSRKKSVDLGRMVMDYRSNLRTYKKIFTCHRYLIKMYDLKSRFRFAIKWYCLALCLGPNPSQKKKMLTCAGWLWIVAPTLVYCQKVTYATYTLYPRMTYSPTSVVGKNVAPEYQSLYNIKKKFSRKKNIDLIRMVMDCRSNLRLWKKIFTYHVYPVITNDLISKFCFAIKSYSWALCLGPNPSQKKKASSCAGWLRVAAPTIAFDRNSLLTTYTL